MKFRYNDGEYRMIADVTPITDSPAANRGRGMIKTGKSPVMRKWHSTAVLLVAIIFALCILPALASAAVTSDIYVNETGWWRDGGAFNASSTRIQAAIDNATAGETIYVYNGTYVENVNIGTSHLTLRGEGKGVVNVTADSVSDHVFEVNVHYVNISGFNLTGATNADYAGIYLNSVEHCNISDNTASNNHRGIRLISSSNNRLTNNTANSNNDSGILLESSSNNTLTSNNADLNTIYGINLYSSSNYNTLTNNIADSNMNGIYLNLTSNYNTLTGNNVSNNSNWNIVLSMSSNNNTLTSNTALLSGGTGGIYLVLSSNNTLTNNTVSGNYFGIYLSYSGNNTLTYNNASGNYFGIFLDYSSNITLTNNTLSGNSFGVFLGDSNNNMLMSNTASNNSQYGIYLESSSNNTIYNNYFNNTNNSYDDGYNIWNTTPTSGTNIIGGSYLGGNYWSDYAGVDNDNDGLGDTLTPHNSSGNITFGGDHHPLVMPGSAAPTFNCTCGDICVNETGWWRDGGAFNESSTRIQAAIDNATAGDTIYVYNGTYIENVNVNEQVTLQGEGADVVTVTNSTADRDVFNVTVDYVNISGFNVSGATTDEFAGIYLDSVEHCYISDNIVSGNDCGILLYNSSDNTLTKNTAFGNYDGILLEDSSYNTLTNNNASGNYCGIILDNSSDNTLTNNTASGNYGGIILDNSSDNTLTNNTASDNVGGILLYTSSYNMLTNNTALSNDCGMLLDTSNYNTLTNNTASGNNIGIFLSISSNNTLTNNTVSGNYFCIILNISNNNTLTNNTASGNDYGISLDDSSNNTLTNNTAENNNGDGIILDNSSNNILTNNTANLNDYSGIYLESSSNNTLTNNNANLNNYSGIYLESSNSNILTNNFVNSNNESGIYLESSNSTTLTNNTANLNYYDGIELYSSSKNTLTNNTVYSNDEEGIGLYDSSENTLMNNIINSNNYSGIYLDFSSDNIIYNNYISNTNNTFDNGNNIWNVTKTAGTNIIGGAYLGGNYWSDYAGTDTNSDGLGDTPYNSSGNILNGGDYHPLVTTENINPVVNTVTLDNPNPYTGDTILVTVNATDNVEVTNVTADGVELTHQSGNIWNGTITAIVGTQYVNVSAKDAAGNIGWNNSTSYLATPDNTDPVVNTVTLNNTTPNTDDAILVTVNATDNVEVTNVTADGVELTHQSGNIWNGTITAIEGTQYVNVSAKDAAGNTGWNNSTSYIATTIDNTDPVINIATPTTSSVAYKSGGQQMYVNFTYVEANPKNYTIQIQNATAIINATTATTTSSPVNVSFIMNATAADGYYNVNVTMWDNFTNSNTATEVEAVLIDSIPPTAPSNLIHTDDAPNGYDNDNSTDISWTGSNDASPVIYCIYKNGTFIDSTESKTYTFTNEMEDPHPYEYNVSAIDSAGNINTTNASVTVIVDYTPPVIHNVSLSDNTTSYGQQIVVSVNATDTITNITRVTAGSTILTHQSGMLWNGTITAGYGTNIITVTAYDNASNTATNNSLSYTGPAAPTNNGGSRGGGGVGGSDEPDNVEESAILRIYLASGGSSTYNFNNVVTSVEVTPERTYGLVAAKIEVLFDQPGSIITDPPNGVLFKYVNVFVGTSGWSEGKFSSSVINFQIPASWFNENNIDPALVTMYKHKDGEWQPLVTTMTGQAGGHYQYSSPTPGFSTFMILGQVGDTGAVEPVATADSGTVADPTPTPEATSTKGTPGFELLLGIMGILVAVYSRRK
jgi:PGF-pre-PGF domain-containing protein